MPAFKSGGYSGWQKAIGIAEALLTSSGGEIVAYCIFDSDREWASAILDRHADASARSIELHVWAHKEIENYLLLPPVLSRYICERRTELELAEVEDELTRALDAICVEDRDDAIDGYSSNYRRMNAKADIKASNRAARALVDTRVLLDGDSRGVAGGKSAFGALSAWSQETFGVSLGKFEVAKSFARNEIPLEVCNVLTAIRNRGEFDEPEPWARRNASPYPLVGGVAGA